MENPTESQSTGAYATSVAATLVASSRVLPRPVILAAEWTQVLHNNAAGGRGLLPLWVLVELFVF